MDENTMVLFMWYYHGTWYGIKYHGTFHVVLPWYLVWYKNTMDENTMVLFTMVFYHGTWHGIPWTKIPWYFSCGITMVPSMV